MQVACEVEREYGQYHIRERGQLSRGMTVTDEWLKKNGFWPLSHSNVGQVTQACLALASGAILDTYASKRIPEELEWKDPTVFHMNGGKK